MHWLGLILMSIPLLSFSHSVLGERLDPSCLKQTKLLGENRPLRFFEINRKERGDRAKEPLFLIHGLGSAWQTFEPLLPTFQSRFFTVALDLRGHGQSAGRGTLYSNYQMARDLQSLVNYYGFSKIHLLGHSYGGRAALAFSILYPERVKTLTLEDVSALDESPPPGKTQKTGESLKALGLEKKRFAHPDEARDALAPYFLPREVDYYVLEKMKKTNRGYRFLLSPHGSYFWDMRGGEDNLSLGFSRINFPVLHIRADPDLDGVSRHEAGLYRESIKGLTDVEMVGTSHRIHTTQPDTFLRYFMEFQGR